MARKRISISKFAHDAARHFLAQPKKYRLTNAVRKDLTEVVEGHTGSYDGDGRQTGHGVDARALPSERRGAALLK